MRTETRVRPVPPAVPAALAALVAMLVLGGAVPPAQADPAENFARGEQMYAAGKLGDAATAYADALKETPNDLRTLCALVRAESEMGEDSKGDDQRRLLGSAVQHARAAVAAAPDSGIAHAWLAAALGRQALHEGKKTALAMSREIKSEADHAIALDPGVARAYHVRAAWNRDLATLNFLERAVANTVLGGVPKGATLDNAVADFEKAVALDSLYVNHHLELGRTYHMVHRDADARRELEKAVALAPKSSARDGKYQADARELLSRLPQTK